MSSDPGSSNATQQQLWDLQESTGRVELFPAVWSAAEALIHPETKKRLEALEKLSELNAVRFSSLVAYLVATRLTDPELNVRAKVVKALGVVLSPDSDSQPAPQEVRRVLMNYLSQMRTRQAYALLQVLSDHPDLEDHVAKLLDACSFASTHLIDILADRSASLEVRVQAVQAIGRVGYLDAIPALERLEGRIETRLNGQRAMPFAPVGGEDEQELLPAIHKTLALLRAP